MLCELQESDDEEDYDNVLILVLMEYALREPDGSRMMLLHGLNPCFNGICSASFLYKTQSQTQISLNPCFNGICSASNSFHSFSID